MNEINFYKIRYAQMCNTILSLCLHNAHPGRTYYHTLNTVYHIDSSILIQLRDLLWYFNKDTNTYHNVLNDQFHSIEQLWIRLEPSEDIIYQLHHVKALEDLVYLIEEYSDLRKEIKKRERRMLGYGVGIGMAVTAPIGVLLGYLFFI